MGKLSRNNNFINAVAEFEKAFGVKDNQYNLYRDLIDEEFHEWFTEAYGLSRNPENELKELCDLLYTIFGYARQRKWDIVAAFNRVHKSNMSKLDNDGKPIYDSKGKIMKGPHYKKPNLKDLV